MRRTAPASASQNSPIAHLTLMSHLSVRTGSAGLGPSSAPTRRRLVAEEAVELDGERAGIGGSGTRRR